MTINSEIIYKLFKGERKNMKKISLLFLTIVITTVFALTGCGGETKPNDETSAPSSNSAAEDKDVTVKVAYYLKDGTEVKSEENTNSVELGLEEKFKSGAKIVVTLSDNHKYLMFKFDDNVQEALIYCPDSVFEYVFESKAAKYFPPSVQIGAAGQNSTPVISAKAAKNVDINATRNLALNPYDTSKSDKAFPHASSNSIYSATGEWDARNAIDGFKTAGGHGGYPHQSWGPEQNKADMYWMVDFGEEVKVTSLGIIIRSDFEHDAYFKKITVEFSDGTEKEFELEKTKEIQSVDFGESIATSSIKIKKFEKSKADWSGLMEVEVNGTRG